MVENREREERTPRGEGQRRRRRSEGSECVSEACVG